MTSEKPDAPVPSCEILLVDDDENVVMVLGDYLSGRGFRVVRATSGEQAIELAREHSEIELAVLDFDMPGMNGMELLEKLNELQGELGRKMHCIFLTAQTSSKVALELLRKQTYFYMSKPVNLRLLSQVLKDAHWELRHPDATPLTSPGFRSS